MGKETRELIDYGRDLDYLIEFISERWDGLNKLEPKGYREFLKGYTDFKGISEYEDGGGAAADAEAFRGLVELSAGSFPFPSRIALCHVAYDDVCQGNTPDRTLLGAVLAYGMLRGALWYRQDLLRSIESSLDFMEFMVEAAQRDKAVKEDVLKHIAESVSWIREVFDREIIM
jgi:hypothetical protein